MKPLAEQMDALLTSSMAWHQMLYSANVQDLLNEPILSLKYRQSLSNFKDSLFEGKYSNNNKSLIIFVKDNEKG